MKTCPLQWSKILAALDGPEAMQPLRAGLARLDRCGLTRKFDKTLWDTTRISPHWKGRLLEFSCLGVPAYRLRFQVPVHQNTLQRWFRILREVNLSAVPQIIPDIRGSDYHLCYYL